MTDFRKQRAATQNIFLIETIIDEKSTERKYVVMGSTGNIYDVIIKNTPQCTCPDFKTRNKRCKHIYFILIRVMKTDKEDQLFYNDAELSEMFSKIPSITNNLIVDESTKNFYHKLKKENKLDNNENEKHINMKSTDDLCPICLDDLEDGNELEYCKYSCGKPIHSLCFSMWCKRNNKKCIYCRKDWEGTNDTKYVNLINKI